MRAKCIQEVGRKAWEPFFFFFEHVNNQLGADVLLVE